MIELTSDSRELYPYRVSSYNNRLYEDESRLIDAAGDHMCGATFYRVEMVAPYFSEI